MDVIPDGRNVAAWTRTARVVGPQPGGDARVVLRPASVVGWAARQAALLAACFAGALARRRQRLDLARLDDRLLEDIGLSRAQARAEAAKPFWKVSLPS